MKTIVSTKGRFTIPAELRRKDEIKSGQECEIERRDCGEYLLTRINKKRNEGLIELLISCPVKDWFQPLEPRTDVTSSMRLAERVEIKTEMPL